MICWKKRFADLLPPANKNQFVLVASKTRLEQALWLVILVL